MRYSFLVFTMLTSLAFGQFSKGVQAIDGEFALFKASEGDAVTMFEFTYGQFIYENLLVGGAILYTDYGGEDDSASTDFALSANFFFNDDFALSANSMYVGVGKTFPDEGDGDTTLQFGMLSPFRESSNVYLNSSLGYYLDAEVFVAGVGLTLLF